MEALTMDFREWANSARRGLEREIDEGSEALKEKQKMLRALEMFAELEQENERLREDLEEERNQLAAERKQRAELEMKMAEMSKLSAGVAKKASQDDLLKALRIFVNKSKHKKIEKRTAVKEMVLELANANGIVFPEDLSATLDSLDDEIHEVPIVIENAEDVIAAGGVKKVRNVKND